MKKFLSIILSILMVVTMIPMAVMPASAATPTPYDGVPVTPQKISSSNYAKLGLTSSNWSQFNGYYAIRNAKELYGFAAVSRSSSTANAVLLQDIVVNANGGTTYDWTPIADQSNRRAYDGIFDGNGHYISGLYSTTAITRAGMNYRDCGFICNLYGTVKNLVIKNSTFAPGIDIGVHGGLGAITGYPYGCTIQNCRVENITLKSINDGGQLGGIAGYGNGGSSTIKNCVSINVTFSGGKYTNSIAPKAPYSSCYTSATASHNCTNLSVEHKEVKATCEYPGLSNYKYCLVCGKVTSGTKTETPATGHTLKSATCIAPKTCTICGATEGSVDNTAHSWANNDGICANGCGATCPHENQTGSVCEICGAELHVCSNYNNGFCTECDAYEPAELKDGYYQIKNGGNLFWYANYINTVDRTANAVLTANIDLENRPWTPIGSTGENSNNFRGIFDGQNYTIKGLNVEGGRAGLGFFGEVRLGTVENFTIYGEVKLNGKYSYVGGVIGSAPGASSSDGSVRNGATIRNITSYVNVTLGEDSNGVGAHGSGYVGGFIGYTNHETLIENCTWYGTLDLGIYRAQSGVGGLVGAAYNNSSVTIRDCAAYGTIKTAYKSGTYNNQATIYIGGIVSNSVASASTTIENTIWAGTIVNDTDLGANAHISAFGTLSGIKGVVNCYALENSAPYITTNNTNCDDITEVTAEQLTSGETAYKLGDAWGQSIGTDAYPVLGGEEVYCGYTSCGDTEAGYTNNAAATQEKPDHTQKPAYTDNHDGTHSAVYPCCGATVAEGPHTLDITTGKCSACGADMTVIATVTDGTNTYYASDAATLNQAVTAILETGSRTFTVELPADTEAEMITAIRRAICDTEGVADGSINLTLKGVTSIPGTTNWDGVAFGPGDIYDEAGEIVDQELVTQLASINLPDVTEIGAQAFYFCENLVSVSAPKAQTIGANAFGYTALTSVEFPELTTIPGTMLGGTWTLSSAKFPKVTTIEQNGLLIGFGFAPENNPTPFPLELTAEGDITFNGSNHFNIASQNYSGKVDLVLNIDKKEQVTFNDDGTATWQVRDDLSYTFKSITFTCTDGTTNHSYTYTDNGDGTHDMVCTGCGYLVVDNEAHSGGTATCTEQAKCEHCGASYGEVDKNNHDETVAYVNGFCPNCDAFEPAKLVNGVYEISNAGNLYWFADKVTNENAAYGSADAILTCDIRVNEGTMTEASTGARVWTPIGKHGFGVNIPYTGTFEGNGKTVSGLYFNDTSANFSVGLFSLVGEGGKVQNVGIADSYLCGSQNIGAVAGSNYGTVTGCYNTGIISGSGNSVGGVVGYNYGTATNCYNTGTVSGTSSVGGVVGSNHGTVTGCYNTGTISGSNDVGGVAGNGGSMSNCYNTGTVSGTNSVGGVVGDNQDTVTGCYNTGTVSGTTSVGGVAGYNWTTVTNCYSSGTVSGTTDVGGVVGFTNATVTNCYFDSTVYTGDAIGNNYGTATDVEGKSTEQFAGGEVAYLLSQGENGSIWGQTIGTDPAPVFSDAKVYCGYTSCGDTVAKYTNDETISAEKPDHTQKPTYTDNGDGTHSAVYPCCGTTVTEEHDFENDAHQCDCGYACPHEKYTDGVCDKCGYECAHTWDEDGYCRKCKTFCKHETNVNGVCTVCDYVLTFSVITGDTVSYYDSFDDALENAEEGSTVKLMKGIEQIASYEINKAITFDLNGNNWDTGSSDYIDVYAFVTFTDSVGTGNLNLSLNLYAPCLFNSGTYKGIDIMFETEDTLDDYLAECHGFFDHYTGEFKDVSDEKYVMGAKVDIYHKLGEQTCKGYQCEECGEYFGEADPDAHDWSNKDGICVICGEECAHEWDEGVLTRPVHDAVLGSKDGYYTYTCIVCAKEKKETVKSADYSAYEAVSVEINTLLQSDELTFEAKQEIYSAAIGHGLLSNDLTESEQNIVDDLVAELEKIIADANEKIASGEYVKIDGMKEYNKIADALDAELMENYSQEEIAALAEKAGDEINARFGEIIEKAEALTGSVAENKDALAEIESELSALYAEMKNCLDGVHNGLVYEVTEEAKCEVNAIESATCTLCGETDEREIEGTALEHEPNEQMCKGYWCSRCRSFYGEGNPDIHLDGYSSTGKIKDGQCDGCNKQLAFIKSGETYEINSYAYVVEFAPVVDGRYILTVDGPEGTEIDVREVVDGVNKGINCEVISDLVYVVDCTVGKTYRFEASNYYGYNISSMTLECETHKGTVQTCYGYICDVCGEYFGEVPGHDIIIDEAVPPTCTQTGLTEGQHCSRCDDMTIIQEKVPATNHKDTLVKVDAKAATCTEAGWEAYEYCTACDYTTYEEIPALKHSFTKYEVTEEAECGKAGKEVAYCDHGCQTTDEREIPALEHIFLDYTSNGDATCTADGTKTAECVNGCGATDTVADEGTMLDHVDEDGDKLCDDCGEEVYDRCDICGGKAHGDDKIQLVFCMIITLIRFVTSILKSIN